MSAPYEYPLIVGIETINTCNARCPFCPLFHGDNPMSRELRPAKVMERALFERVVEQIATWPTKPGAIYLNMNGEPLQDPDIRERLSYLCQRGLAGLVIIQTNGHFLSEELAQALLDSKLGRVTIGFDGASKEIYERSRVRCNYDEVLTNIRAFARMRDQGGYRTEIAIQYVRTRDNAHEVEPAFRMFSEFLSADKDMFNDTPSKNWSGGSEDDLYLFRPDASTRRLGCQSFASQLIVTSDGKLQACAWDYNLFVSDGGLGDANETGLLDIWNGLKRLDLKRRLSTPEMNDKPAKCRVCPSLYVNDQLPIDGAAIADRTIVSATPYGYIYRFVPREDSKLPGL